MDILLAWMYIKAMIQRLNSKFDQIEEPNRFLVFLAMIVPVCFLTSFVPLVGMPILLVLLVIRVLYLKGFFKAA